MKTKKEKIQTFGILAIVLAVYLLLVFVIPFAKTTMFWLALTFTLVSFGVEAFVLWQWLTKGADARSRFYGFPIVRVGVLYLGAQLVLSFVFMALAAHCPVRVGVVVMALLLAAAAIGLIAADAARTEIERQDAQLKTDVTAMRALQSRAAALPARCEDAALKSDAQKLSDAFRYSDPVSNAATKNTEHELAVCMDELERAVLERDAAGAQSLIRRADALLAERNRLCRLNK